MDIDIMYIKRSLVAQYDDAYMCWTTPKQHLYLVKKLSKTEAE